MNRRALLVIGGLAILALFAASDAVHGRDPTVEVREIRDELSGRNLAQLPLQARDPLSARNLLSDLEHELTSDRYVDPARLQRLAAQFRAADSGLLELAPVVERFARAWTVPEPATWSEFCRQGASEVESISSQDWSAEQARLELTLGGMEQVLAQLGDRRAPWEEYLFWQATRQLPRATVYDPAELDRLQIRWTNAALVWNNGTLQITANAVRRFIEHARRHDATALTDTLRKRLEGLAQLLQNPESVTLAHQQAELSETVALMERFGILPHLTNAIRQKYASPDCVIRISDNLLRRHLEVSVNEQFPVNGVFEGTTTNGRGQLSGTLSWSPVASDSLARWRWSYAATINSSTTGLNSGVRIDSRSTAYVNGQKQFRLDATGLSTVPATADAIATVVFDNVVSGGRAIRRQRATNEVLSNRERIQSLTAQTARQETAARLDREGSQLVETFNNTYEQNFRRPLGRTLDYVTNIQTGCDDAGIAWQAWIEPPFQLMSHEPPPLSVPEADFTTFVHSQFVERMADVELRGRLVTSQEIAQQIEAWRGTSRGAATDGETRRTPAAAAAGDEWQIRFAPEKPAVCTVADGIVKVQFRLAEFSSPDAAYPSVAIQVAYRPEWQAGECRWTRVGDIDVHPLDYQPGRRMSGRQLTLRRAIQRRLGQLLTEQWVLRPFVQEFGGQTLRLEAHHVALKDGWLCLGWRHAVRVGEVAGE